MSYILVRVVHVLPQFGDNNVFKGASVELTSVLFDNLGGAELHVGDLVSTGLDQGRHDVLSDVVFAKLVHNSSKRAERAHAVVERLFINAVSFVNLGEVVLDNPIRTELGSQSSRLSDSFLAYSSSGVG